MKSKKHESYENIKKKNESYRNHTEREKKLCFRLNKNIFMKKSIWSNKKNQNDDFDQDNKMKLHKKNGLISIK